MMACYYMHSLRYCHLNVESSGFVIFLGVIWVLQETTDIRILRYIILFIGRCNSALFLSVLFSEVYCNASCVSDEESQLNNCRCDEQLVFSSGYGFWKKNYLFLIFTVWVCCCIIDALTACMTAQIFMMISYLEEFTQVMLRNLQKCVLAHVMALDGASFGKHCYSSKYGWYQPGDSVSVV